MSGDEPASHLRAVREAERDGRRGVDDLLVAAGRGDETAFARLYDAFAPSVFGLARRVVRDPAPDARTVSAPMRGGGSMTVVSSRSLDQAVVLGERMPRLDRAHDDQLWLVGRSGTIRSAGVLFDGSGRASTGPGLVRGLAPVTRSPSPASPRAGRGSPSPPRWPSPGARERHQAGQGRRTRALASSLPLA